jgi:hypothetical protein
MSRDDLMPDTPLPLALAAKEAFPPGTMTAAILRKEGSRGNLDIMRIGGRLFTTLADIEEMKRRCRLKPRDRDCGSSPATEGGTASASPASGSSRTETPELAQASARLVAESLRKKLKTPSQSTSSGGARSRESATVTPFPSASRT